MYLGTAGLAIGTIQAAQAADDLDYTYLEIKGIVIDIDDFQDDTADLTERYDDGSGFALEGSFQLTDLIFLFGRYSDTNSDATVETDDIFVPGNRDVTRLDLGVGFAVELSDSTDFVTRAAYTDIDLGEFEIGVSSDLDTLDEDSSDGFTVDAGIRSQLTDRMEGSIGLRYLTIDSDDPRRDDDNTSVYGSLLFELGDYWDIDLTADVGDSVRYYSLGFRFSPPGAGLD
jgi:opacity protein-like surface antigen